MRWHVAVLQSWSQRSQRAWSKQPPAAYFITHSSTRARLSSSLFRTCLFSADTHPQVWPSAAQIHTGIPRCRSPSPEGGVFLVQPFWLILSIYGSRGSSRSPGTAVASSSSQQAAEFSTRRDQNREIKKSKTRNCLRLFSCGGPTRTNDLQVMSLASYQLLHSAILNLLGNLVSRLRVQR